MPCCGKVVARCSDSAFARQARELRGVAALLEVADQRVEIASALGPEPTTRGGEESLVHAVGIGWLEVNGAVLERFPGGRTDNDCSALLGRERFRETVVDDDRDAFCERLHG